MSESKSNDELFLEKVRSLHGDGVYAWNFTVKKMLLDYLCSEYLKVSGTGKLLTLTELKASNMNTYCKLQLFFHQLYELGEWVKFSPKEKGVGKSISVTFIKKTVADYLIYRNRRFQVPVIEKRKKKSSDRPKPSKSKKLKPSPAKKKKKQQQQKITFLDSQMPVDDRRRFIFGGREYAFFSSLKGYTGKVTTGEEHKDYCEKCKGPSEQCVECDICMCVYHRRCMTPPLTEGVALPKGLFACGKKCIEKVETELSKM